jgi:hypothetical protein
MRDSCHRHLPRERFRPLALSWRNLPCALKAAIDIGKRTLAILAAPTTFATAWTCGKAEFGSPPQQAAGPQLGGFFIVEISRDILKPLG